MHRASDGVGRAALGRGHVPVHRSEALGDMAEALRHDQSMRAEWAETAHALLGQAMDLVEQSKAPLEKLAGHSTAHAAAGIYNQLRLLQRVAEQQAPDGEIQPQRLTHTPAGEQAHRTSPDASGTQIEQGPPAA